MRPATRPTRALTSVLGAALVAASAACASPDPDADLEPRLRRMLPTQAPSPTLVPDTAPPLELREATGPHFTLRVPGNFQEQTTGTAAGGTKHVFEAPSSTPEAPVRVVVIDDVAPASGALEQSYAAQVAHEATTSPGFRRSALTWPGAERAFLLQYTQGPSGSAGGADLTVWHVMAQVSPGLIVNAVAVAPSRDFAEANLDEVLATFRPKA